jgi:HlyD family secretion protein
VGLGLAALLFVWRWNGGNNSSDVRYKTAPAQRGDLTVSVSATGNLEPTEQVLVGIEVSGTIKSVEVDYNDFVKAGQILAKLDTTRLMAQARQSEAVMASAKAKVLLAQASLLEAGQEMERLQKIRKDSGGQLPSAHEFEAAFAKLKRAEADKAVSEATIDEAQARLQINKIDLEKSMVVSPIDGVVLKRSVEPGQTVAASFQSPELFTLAQDLAKMELQVNVDEADVGQVKAGQTATFTVDAYPDRTFPALITQVRYGAKVTNGVVTYLTILNVDNGDLALRPGMTATADIVIAKIAHALQVPSAALRFTPAREEGEDRGVSGKSSGPSLVNKIFPRFRGKKPSPKKDVSNKDHQQVWILRDNKPVAIPVKTGTTSGMMTEILSGDLDEGTELLVETMSAKGA